jgi:hypothetical protein
VRSHGAVEAAGERAIGDGSLDQRQDHYKQQLLLPQLQRLCAPSYKYVLFHQDSGVAPKLELSKEGWQVVKHNSLRPYTMPQVVSEAHQQHDQHSLYLRKMKGLIFNCLTRYH